MVYIKSNWGLQPAASSQHQTLIGEWKVFRWFQSSAFGSSGWGSVHNGAEKVISVVLCMNFWPTESVSNINDCFTPHCRGNLLCRHSNVKSTNISQFQMIQNELYWQILRWFGIIYSLVAQLVLAWKIPGMGVPGGLPSVGSHRFGHDSSDLAAAAAQSVKNLPAAQETGIQSQSGRSPGEGNGNPLQYSCLENSMARGAWQATSMGSQELDTT